MEELKVKRLNISAKMPIQATEGSACWDVFASSEPVHIKDGFFVQYHTGLAFEIPEGYDMLLFPRSSVSKTGLVLANSVGIIDQDYRGELILRFYKVNPDAALYRKGDRIGQIRLIKRNPVSLVEVETLSATERGAGGFGSTGK